MALAGWVDTSATDLPPWCADVPPGERDRYLATAWEMCVEYLGGVDPVPAGTAPPARLVTAQLEYAADVMRSSHATADSAIGPDGITIVVPSMSWQIKQKLRPKRGARFIR